ncbi:sigma-54 dependent transcriptional regulator [bacterium]|nr:sigma-54 dependent transcriptional regulator [bacterium]MDC0275998.1 sigma-54 dependent transcriptional regulator [Verrucomicrobiales bacterium]MDC0322081.1 sigma-54 dependent transcriptional regulator [Verrucomicrobiales bacterium]
MIDFTEITVLIVDDEKNTRDGLRMSFEDEFDVYVAANMAEAHEVLKSELVDVMVTDLRLGGEDGMELIDQALKIPKPPICILMTAYGSVDLAVEAMKRGAYDYVGKPLNIDELELIIKRAVRTRTVETENVALKQQVEKRFNLNNVIGESRAMQPVFETVQQVAPTRATVLIEGESGTGKELIGHAIHNLSGRPKSKLVIVHCAALSEQLLESELFGHEKGAFTGATERRKGRFEEADGGTLFLDEIGEIDSSIQVKLLRALGERTFERLGSNKPIKVDVRVVAATNKNLEELVEKGEFRDDLFFRLNVVKVTMPPLRERREDIVLLANAFLKEFAEENNKPIRELTNDAMQRLISYEWPGNVRELRTAIEHGVVMCNAAKIALKHLPVFLQAGRELAFYKGTAATDSPAAIEPEDLNLENMEKRMIDVALGQTGGNRTEAAKLLGISRRTLQRKLKED